MQNNLDKDVYELIDKEYLVYPWFFDKTKPENLENWEFRQVKIIGKIMDGFFLINQRRNEEDGYMVFGGLQTGIKHLRSN